MAVRLTQRTPREYAIAALVLGAVSFMVNILTKGLGPAPVIGILLDMVALGVAVLSAQQAKRQGKSAAWAGARMGALYAAVGALSAFLITVTPAEVAAELRKSALPHTPVSPQQIAALANSPSAHLTSWITGVIFLGLLGLAAGTIAGALTRRPDEPRPV